MMKKIPNKRLAAYMTNYLAIITSMENPTVLNSKEFIKAIRETLEGLLA